MYGGTRRRAGRRSESRDYSSPRLGARGRAGHHVFLERLTLKGDIVDVDPLRRALQELEHLVVVVVGLRSIRVLDVALLVLEPNDPDDSVRVLVLDRELAGDPTARIVRRGLRLGIFPEGVELAGLDFRAQDRKSVV